MKLSLPLLLLALCAALTVGTPAQARKDGSNGAAAKSAKTAKVASVRKPAASARLRSGARQAVVVRGPGLRRVAALQAVEPAKPSFGI